jgi:hypothetical protein
MILSYFVDVILHDVCEITNKVFLKFAWSAHMQLGWVYGSTVDYRVVSLLVTRE